MPRLPIHFFTIVLNGEPFIRYHHDRMSRLPFDWHWHVVEGAAELVGDTAWSIPFGGKLPEGVAIDGRSVDGTSEYLDAVAASDPAHVTLYRRTDGMAWQGKLEMVSAPLGNLPDSCLLWQIDADELWTVEQWIKLRDLFLTHTERNSASFYCRYFVGPGLEIDRRSSPHEIEWRRVWRYRKGMAWLKHEPPILATQSPAGNWIDLATWKPWWPVEMENQGLVFEHHAYATEAQVRFKEQYYGCQGLLEQWQRLQAVPLPIRLKDFFDWDWVDRDTVVNRVFEGDAPPIPALTDRGWQFRDPAPDPKPRRGVLFVVWGPDETWLNRSIQSVRDIHPELPIHIHRHEADATLLDKSEMFDLSPFDTTLYLDADTVILDRLDFGFEMAERHGLACCICECPWARRYAGLAGDLPEYNTGVIFFTSKARAIFDRWKLKSREIDSSILFLQENEVKVMPLNDQASFSLAVAAADHPPFVLPLNYNFRPQWHRSWFGPIKVWHDYGNIPEAIREWTNQQKRPEAIIQYVSSIYHAIEGDSPVRPIGAPGNPPISAT